MPTICLLTYKCKSKEVTRDLVHRMRQCEPISLHYVQYHISFIAEFKFPSLKFDLNSYSTYVKTSHYILPVVMLKYEVVKANSNFTVTFALKSIKLRLERDIQQQQQPSPSFLCSSLFSGLSRRHRSGTVRKAVSQPSLLTPMKDETVYGASRLPVLSSADTN